MTDLESYQNRDFYTELVTHVVNFYFHNHTCPSIQQLSDHFFLPTETIQELLKDKTVVQVLKSKYLYDGFYSKKIPGFSLKQIEVLTVLSNQHDKRTPLAKFKACKITAAQFQRWMEDPKFATVLNSRIEEAFHNDSGRILQAVVETAVGGDVQAQKLALELMGRYTPTSRITGNINVSDSNKTVSLLIEVIQTVCTREQTEEIARKFSEVMNGGTLSLKVGTTSVIDVPALPEQTFEI